jgi:sugar lactone lactonase YvrE
MRRGGWPSAQTGTYVADYGAGEVYQVDGSGNVMPFAAIAQAYGVLANGSNLEVSTFNSAGQVLTLNSTGATVGTLTTGSTNLANLTYGPDGDLYVSSQGAGAVLQYDGTSWTSFASLAGNSNLPTPRGLVFDGDTLYVADSSTNTSGGSGSGVYAFTISGTDTADGLSASSETEFYSTYNDGTKGLILDPSTGDLYLAETVANEVVQVPDRRHSRCR